MSPTSILLLRRKCHKQHQTNQWMRAIGLALILSTLNLSLTVSDAQAQSRTAAVQEGYTLLERGWVNDAIAAFQQALRDNPQSLEAKLGLAIAYQRAGQDEAAWQSYQQVIRQDPNQPEALAALGLLGGYRPAWNQAGIEALTTLLTLQPENTAARSQRALLFGYQGLFTQALTDYGQVLSGNPSSQVILEAAQVYTYSGNFAASLALFNQYLRSNSPIPDAALATYGRALQESGQAEMAIRVLTERLPALPSESALTFELQAVLAMAYQSNQQPEQALLSLEPLRDQPAAQLPLARALSTIGRQTQDSALYAEAVELYRQVLYRQASYQQPSQTAAAAPGLLAEIADVLSEMPSTRPEALQLYQQVLTQQPDRIGVQVKALWLSYQLGELSQQAFQQQVRQLQQSLGTGNSASIQHQQFAQALVQLDPPDPALLAVYQTLLEQETNTPFLHFRVAQIYLQQGDLNAARTSLATYRQSVTAGELTTDPAADLLLAEIERQEGDLTASAQRYQQIAQRYANRPAAKDALRGLAGIYLAQGQPAEALRLYEQLQAAYPRDTALPLGTAAIAYQQQQLSETAAVEVLNTWLETEPLGMLAASPTALPPELFLLVGALPADPERAALYDLLLAAEPNHIAINRRWAQLWAKADPDRVRARIEQRLSQMPNSMEAELAQAELAQAIGDWDLASQAYGTILEQQPDQVDALLGLAGVRFQQKRYAAAEQLYRQVLAQRPEDLVLRRVLVDLHLAQDQPIAALEELQQLQPDVNPPIRARIHRLQIEFLRRRGFQPSWERY